jgi:predicted DCC family thiol-disulfide oxidoreductase YuxK
VFGGGALRLFFRSIRPAVPVRRVSGLNRRISGGVATEEDGVTTGFTILIDGQCSLCRREAAAMQRMDAGRGALKIVDIAAPGFVAAEYGITDDEAMGQIHGVTPDGRVLTGLAVFRHAYGALARGGGIGAKCMSALFAVAGWPLVRVAANAGYRWFARHRIAISSRVGRLLGDEPVVCATDRCKMP